MPEPSLEQQARKLLRHPPGSIDALFLTRVLRVFETLARDLPKEALSAAATAPSDFEAVLQAILAGRGRWVDFDREKNPLALARLRGQQARLALLSSEGGILSAAQVAELLNISRQAVNKRRQTGQLLALPVGRRRFAYPAWQLAAGETLPGLEAVLERLADHDPWMQGRFFLMANQRLGDRRPLDELRQGNVEAVIAAAAVYGEHGAA